MVGPLFHSSFFRIQAYRTREKGGKGFFHLRVPPESCLEWQCLLCGWCPNAASLIGCSCLFFRGACRGPVCCPGISEIASSNSHWVPVPMDCFTAIFYLVFSLAWSEVLLGGIPVRWLKSGYFLSTYWTIGDSSILVKSNERTKAAPQMPPFLLLPIHFAPFKLLTSLAS